MHQKARRSEPDDFGFGWIEAQSVAGHPGFDMGDAVHHLSHQLRGLSRAGMSVHLKVVSVGTSGETALLDELDDAGCIQRNNTGPRTLPQGTPQVTSVIAETSPLKRTNWDRPVK